MKEYRNLWNKRKWQEVIWNLLYPPVCPFCGRPVKGGACGECAKKIVYAGEPRCKKCGKPIRTEEAEYCFDCSTHRHAFTEGRSLYVHKTPVREAVYALKYQNRKVYGLFFAREMAEKYRDYLIKKEIDFIVPIPLHKKKKRQRGYNQAEILAGELSRCTGIERNTRILRRNKNTQPQKNLNDKERRHNIRGAFQAETLPGRGKNILLVDDIYTTGSTVDEAARTLLKAGAENVYFLTISIGQGY